MLSRELCEPGPDLVAQFDHSAPLGLVNDICPVHVRMLVEDRDLSVPACLWFLLCRFGHVTFPFASIFLAGGCCLTLGLFLGTPRSASFLSLLLDFWRLGAWDCICFLLACLARVEMRRYNEVERRYNADASL